MIQKLGERWEVRRGGKGEVDGFGGQFYLLT